MSCMMPSDAEQNAEAPCDVAQGCSGPRHFARFPRGPRSESFTCEYTLIRPHFFLFVLPVYRFSIAAPCSVSRVLWQSSDHCYFGIEFVISSCEERPSMQLPAFGSVFHRRRPCYLDSVSPFLRRQSNFQLFIIFVNSLLVCLITAT